MDGRDPSRREVLASVAAAGALAGCDGFGSGGTPEGQPTDADGHGAGADAEDGPGTRGAGDVGTLTLRADVIADGFASPVDVAAPGAGELWVLDQVGTVTRVLGEAGTTEELLDLRDRTVDVSGYDERGLLGIALHPDYGDNGRVFLRYSAPPRGGTPEGYSHTFVVAEFAAIPDEGTIDADSERTILEVPQPQSNHDAGPIAFGPDGYLYVTVGDGGGANDQGTGHVDDWYDAVEGGNGQDVAEKLLGSVLRVDVDGDGAYAIPDDNPLVGGAGLDEYYAWGLRNPYGIAFGPEGRGFVVDVGQDRFEEVNVLEAGANYGWNVREGFECFGVEDCPDETPEGEPLVDPIVAYPHSGQPVSGPAVVGGQLYDGAAVPALQGTYVFGDWQPRGNLFVATEGPEGWDAQAVPVLGDVGSSLLRIGTDADGELLVLSSERREVAGETGSVARISAE